MKMSKPTEFRATDIAARIATSTDLVRRATELAHGSEVGVSINQTDLGFAIIAAGNDYHRHAEELAQSRVTELSDRGREIIAQIAEAQPQPAVDRHDADQGQLVDDVAAQVHALALEVADAEIATRKYERRFDIEGLDPGKPFNGKAVFGWAAGFVALTIVTALFYADMLANGAVGGLALGLVLEASKYVLGWLYAVGWMKAHRNAPSKWVGWLTCAAIALAVAPLILLEAHVRAVEGTGTLAIIAGMAADNLWDNPLGGLTDFRAAAFAAITVGVIVWIARSARDYVGRFPAHRRIKLYEIALRDRYDAEVKAITDRSAVVFEKAKGTINAYRAVVRRSSDKIRGFVNACSAETAEGGRQHRAHEAIEDAVETSMARSYSAAIAGGPAGSTSVLPSQYQRLDWREPKLAQAGALLEEMRECEAGCDSKVRSALKCAREDAGRALLAILSQAADILECARRGVRWLPTHNPPQQPLLS